MDGFKRALKYSLRFRLSLGLSLALVGAALVVGLLSLVLAFIEANRIQDDQLKQMAVLASGYGDALPAWNLKRLRDDLREDDALISIQILGKGEYPDDSQAFRYIPALSADIPDGFSTIALKRTWRVYVRSLPDGKRLAAAQRIEYRNELVRNNALRTVVPLLFLLPIVLVIVTMIVRRMFRPVVALSQSIDQKTQYDLRSLDIEDIPDEIRNFALSINRLLARITKALETERRFLANAAHELRSPLTALYLQMQNIDRAASPGEKAERWQAMRQGMSRTVALLNQLLDMARAQSDTVTMPKTLDAKRALVGIIEEMHPVASENRIDLGIVGEANPAFPIGEGDFGMIVRNLVGNALKYTPPGGQVDIVLREDEEAVSLVVSDTGPGIPNEEWGRVFEPFYRIAGNDAMGSGLGLAIVKSAVERNQGTITLSAPEHGTGLKAVACFRKISPKRPMG